MKKDWKITIKKECPECKGRGSVPETGIHEAPCSNCGTLGILIKDITLIKLKELLNNK